MRENGEALFHIFADWDFCGDHWRMCKYDAWMDWVNFICGAISSNTDCRTCGMHGIDPSQDRSNEARLILNR